MQTAYCSNEAHPTSESRSHQFSPSWPGNLSKGLDQMVRGKEPWKVMEIAIRTGLLLYALNTLSQHHFHPLTASFQKPVSSLRSHFENMSNIDPNLPAMPCRSAINGYHPSFPHRKEPQNPLRASSDSSLQSSGCGGCSDSSPQRLNLPHSQRLRSTVTPQGPLSISSLFAPQSAPLVTVDSPEAPSKGSGQSNILPPPLPTVPSPSPQERRIPTARPEHVPSSMWSATTKPTEEHLGRYVTPSTGTLVSRGGNAGNSVDPSLPRPPLQDGSRPPRIVNSTKGIVPPPISRVGKPKIPTKPPKEGIEPGLKPSALPANERASPFSTPPSSDEDAKFEVSHISADSAPKRGTASVLSDEGRRFSTCPGTTQLKNPERYPGIESLQILEHGDARPYGFNSTSERHTYRDDDRPGLPPRRLREDCDTLGLTGARRLSEKAKMNGSPQRGTQTTGATSSTILPHSSANTLPIDSRPLDDHAPIVAHSGAEARGYGDYGIDASAGNTASFPDMSNVNRRFPYCPAGARAIDIGYDARLIDVCGRHLCTAGLATRVWDVITGELLFSLSHVEKDIKVTALAFRPGAKADDEGSCLWLGTNYGEIQEVDVRSQSIVQTKAGAHERREIVKILRHQNTMWTLDDGGRLCVWPANELGLPSLQRSHITHRVPKGHTCSLVIQDTLWLAIGKDIRLYRPKMGDSAAFSVLPAPLGQPQLGPITAGSVIGGQTDRVYFGHTDGKVSVYSIVDYSCLAIVHVNVYKINALAGAGFYLWAAYSIGMIFVYDTRNEPWITKKSWMAHQGSPILNLTVDRSSLWRTGVLRVASVGSDDVVRFWDGTLENDWMESDMQEHDVRYCAFREVSAHIVTWNAGAATPTHLRYEEADSKFFYDMFCTHEPADLLVFGFQELVDLEDKKLTAKTLFKGNRKKDPAEQEHMSHQHRAWRDYLIQCVEDTMPSHEPYQLLHTANMVGLFSCVFIKTSQRNRVRKINAGEVKRALIVRFLLDDSSICLVNCHLAAGQTQTSNRNNDLTAILDSEVLPAENDAVVGNTVFTDGGDGSMILDHEICILNGDLNYRIDTMSRDTVIKAVNANNLAKLLERDQLLVSRRRNPAFRLRTFRESPISFAPTYKYDVGSDRYDTSEKRRAPAWCDRILYRGVGRIKQLNYRRHELRVSDHRPVSGTFKMRIKSISADKHAEAWSLCIKRFNIVKEKLATESKLDYLRDVLGVPNDEARRLCLVSTIRVRLTATSSAHLGREYVYGIYKFNDKKGLRIGEDDGCVKLCRERMRRLSDHWTHGRRYHKATSS
ncbi:MAG: hypothetical protein Q9217_002060 [Psora testacea]